MSAIKDILNKLNELKELQESQDDRMRELEKAASNAKQAMIDAQRAVHDYDEMRKHNDEKIGMLDMILTALNLELDARTSTANQFLHSLNNTDDQNRFVDFMLTQGVDISKLAMPEDQEGKT